MFGAPVIFWTPGHQRPSEPLARHSGMETVVLSDITCAILDNCRSKSRDEVGMGGMSLGNMGRRTRPQIPLLRTSVRPSLLKCTPLSARILIISGLVELVAVPALTSKPRLGPIEPGRGQSAAHPLVDGIQARAS